MLSHGDKIIATARNNGQIKPLKNPGADTLANDVTASLLDLKKQLEHPDNIRDRIDWSFNDAGEWLLDRTMGQGTDVT